MASRPAVALNHCRSESTSDTNAIGVSVTSRACSTKRLKRASRGVSSMPRRCSAASRCSSSGATGAASHRHAFRSTAARSLVRMWAIDAGSTIQSVMPAVENDGIARRVTPSTPALPSTERDALSSSTSSTTTASERSPASGRTVSPSAIAAASTAVSSSGSLVATATPTARSRVAGTTVAAPPAACARGRPTPRTSRTDPSAAASTWRTVAVGGRQRTRSAQEVVDPVVVTLRVVVVEHEPTHTGCSGQRDGVLHRAVTPADLGRVAGGVVLRVVHHHVGIGEEVRVAGVGSAQPRQGAAGKSRVMGLVVGGVHDGGAVGLDAETEGERGVVQVLGPDGRVTDLEHPFDQVVVAHLRVHLVQADREVLVLHLSGEHVVEASASVRAGRTHPIGCRGRRAARRTEDRGCDPSGCDRSGSRPQAVSPVRGRLQQLQAERPDPSAAVENEERPAIGAHLDARGVPAVSHGARSRRRHRPPRTPEPDVHGPSLPLRESREIRASATARGGWDASRPPT